eukprot:TRINITY_DN1941_c0_g1_i1.p1 TRINITY_DN1941_c0_g1~~TRINITY_DN1941_c0_g1_i1.p1  ORF type:complete len:1049 (+),score=103.21 TRINITY_DN1941_c0_g1_i1:37-3147(+)
MARSGLCVLGWAVCLLFCICVLGSSPSSEDGATFANDMERPDDAPGTHIEDYPFYSHEGTVISPSATPMDRWVLSQDLGYYLQLAPVRSFGIPVKVNLVLIGLDGISGVSASHLRRWLEHVEHSLEHLNVPDQMKVTDPQAKHAPSHVHYSFDYTLVQVHPLVTTLVEDTLIWHLRAEDPAYSHKQRSAAGATPDTDMFYMDAFKMAGLFESLLGHLGMVYDSFTIIMINPRSPAPTGRYGYRMGFSNLELKKLHRHPNITLPASARVTPHETTEAPPRPSPAKQRNTDRKEDPLPHGRVVDLTAESEEWANQFIRQMARPPTDHAAPDPCDLGAAEDEESTLCLQRKLSRADGGQGLVDADSQGMDIVQLAQYLLANGTRYERQYVQAAYLTEDMSEEALVDVWVSHRRFAFVDLTAGPFEWGPVVGGEGMKTSHSKPRAPASQLRQPSSPDAAQQESKTVRSTVEVVPDNEAISKLEAELAIIEMFIVRACAEIPHAQPQEQLKSGVDSPRCTDLQTRRVRIEMKIRIYKEAVSKGILPSLVTDPVSGRRLEQTGEVDTEFTGQDGENTVHSAGAGQPDPVDDFMSSMGAMVTSALRHLVAPSTTVFPVHVNQRVNFQVILVTNHDVYNPRSPTTFDYDAFKHEVLKFKLPWQEFNFAIRNLSMGDDPGLSLAFSTALKSTIVPIISSANQNSSECELTPDRRYGVDISSRPVLYIDSLEMQRHLRRMTPDLRDENTRIPFGAKHIPIFIFSLANQLPVFIDKSHQSRALTNMVIAVQSNHTSWQSKIESNGQALHLNLRAPLRSVLMSTVTLLSGLLPAHVSYSPIHQRASQEWMWAVGDNPLAGVASSWAQWSTHFTEYQREIAWRNWIVSAVEMGIQSLNQGLLTLDEKKTTAANFAAMKILPLDMLANQYHDTRGTWLKVAQAWDARDFSEAVKLADQAARGADKFHSLCGDVAKVLDVAQCFSPDGSLAPSRDEQIDGLSSETVEMSDEEVKPSRFRIGWLLYLSIAVDILLVLLFCVLRRAKPKVKIN